MVIQDLVLVGILDLSVLLSESEFFTQVWRLWAVFGRDWRVIILPVSFPESMCVGDTDRVRDIAHSRRRPYQCVYASYMYIILS